MEIIPYLLGAVVFVLLVYWSAANAARGEGQPSFGLFRYTESKRAAAAEEQERKRQRRAFKPLQPDPPPERRGAGRPAAARPDSAPPRPGAGWSGPAQRPPRR